MRFCSRPSPRSNDASRRLLPLSRSSFSTSRRSPEPRNARRPTDPPAVDVNVPTITHFILSQGTISNSCDWCNRHIQQLLNSLGVRSFDLAQRRLLFCNQAKMQPNSTKDKYTAHITLSSRPGEEPSFKMEAFQEMRNERMTTPHLARCNAQIVRYQFVPTLRPWMSYRSEIRTFSRQDLEHSFGSMTFHFLERTYQ